MITTKQTFGTAQEVRNFLAQFGFAPFKKGLTRGEFKANGKVARFSLQIAGKTGQSSTGAGWAYFVVVEG